MPQSDRPMYPFLTIKLDKIEHNARAITQLCRKRGISITGVTKGVCGQPEIAAAMLRGGVDSIGESRFENIDRLRGAGIEAPVLQLRLPPLTGAERVVAQADMSLNSEPAVLEALSDHAIRSGRVHEVILMVDMGDLREGVMPESLPGLIADVLPLAGIRLVGIGANFACLCGAIPTKDTMHRLVDLAEGVERDFNLSLRWVSGFNSSGLELVASDQMPARINHGRVGEAILLGREAAYRKSWPDTFQDAFVLHAEILELQTKPSVPSGERGQDAFGDYPSFEDRGARRRALLNIGREDVGVGTLTPTEPGISVIGSSSGYLVVDVTEVARPVCVGDELSFSPDYGALLAAMTSEYVKKRPLPRGLKA